MVEVNEVRSAERYSAKEPISGSFGAASIGVVNLSYHGAMIEHAQPLRLATKSRLWFKHADITVAVQAIVVWSRLSKQPNAKGKYLYHSGLRVDSGAADLAAALQALANRGLVSLDMETLDRKRQRTEEREREKTSPRMRAVNTETGITLDQMLLIRHASDRLRANPEEARRWFEKTKDSAPDDVVKHGREVMAVWEYLERTIDAGVIAKCLMK
jgi:hypothetical protein